MRSVWGSAHIETMLTVCPQFLALHSKLNKQISVFCQLEIPMSLALAKHIMVLEKAQNQEPEGCKIRRNEWRGHGTLLAEPTIMQVRD